MRIHKIKHFFVALWFCGGMLVPNCAQAVFLHSYDDWSGPYIGGVFNYGKDDAWSTFLALLKKNTNTLHWGLFGGYAIQSESLVFSLEGEYDNVPKTHLNANAGESVYKGSLIAHVGLPFGRLLPYALLGPEFNYSKRLDHAGKLQQNFEPGLAIGAGVQFLLSDMLFTRLEYRKSFTHMAQNADNWQNDFRECKSLFDTSNIRLAVGLKF